MNCNEDCSCIKSTLHTILELQKKCGRIENILESCDRPFLGESPICDNVNTRPFNLFTCSDFNMWELPYTTECSEGSSSVFRIEALDGCCATCRVLAPNPRKCKNPYIATNSFFTINLNCVGAIKCLPDTEIECI